MDRDRATVGYDHLVGGRSQCWSLHPGQSTGGWVKTDPENMFMNISRGEVRHFNKVY